MVSEERQKKVKRFFAILLFVVGVGMLLFIANTMYTVYRNSAISDSNETVEARIDVECNQIYFDVLVVNDVLLIKNNVISSYSLDEFSFVDLDSGETETKVAPFFRPGKEFEFETSEIGFESFYIFPFDCRNVAQICNVSEGVCFDPDSYFED